MDWFLYDRDRVLDDRELNKIDVIHNASMNGLPANSRKHIYIYIYINTSICGKEGRGDSEPFMFLS